MNVLDYIVILIFTLIVLVAGLSFRKSGSSIKSFFAAGGQLPWWLSGLSLFMSFFSAGTFVVWGSIAYELGWVAISIQWMMSISGFLIGFFIADKWRATGALTVGEYLGNRFGEKLKNFYSYIFLFLSFITTGAFLYPVAKLFNVSSGFSIELCIIILGLIIILYTAVGGLWAVIITDVLQFVILFSAVLIVVPLAFERIDGINAFISNVPSDFFHFTNGEYTYWFLFAFLFYNTIFIGGNWAYVQRYTSVGTPRDAKKVGWLVGALYIISPVLWMLPAMIYRIVNNDLQGLENEGAFLLMCREVLPRGLVGLMLGGMMFATASSVNTTLNMSSAVFTNDIYNKLARNASELGLMRIARLSTIIFGLITIGVALLVPMAGGIVEVVISVGAITGAPLFAPPIWALFSRRQTAHSIITTTLLSLAVNLIFKFFTPWYFDYALSRAEEMLVGVIGPLLILLFFEFINEKDASTSSEEDSRQQSEIKQEVPINKDENNFALHVLGYALIATGFIFGALGLMTENGKGIVLMMSVIVIVLGIVLKRTKPKKARHLHSE